MQVAYYYDAYIIVVPQPMEQVPHLSEYVRASEGTCPPAREYYPPPSPRGEGEGCSYLTLFYLFWIVYHVYEM